MALWSSICLFARADDCLPPDNTVPVVSKMQRSLIVIRTEKAVLKT